MATDGRQVLWLATGMTALTSLLIQMQAEETGVAPEETLAVLGRRVQELLPGPGRCAPSRHLSTTTLWSFHRIKRCRLYGGDLTIRRIVAGEKWVDGSRGYAAATVCSYRSWIGRLHSCSSAGCPSTGRPGEVRI